MELITKFKTELSNNCHPNEIVWLNEERMHLTKSGLLIYLSKSYVSESQIAGIYNTYKNKLECGGTFMLVAVVDDISYCTFLLDSFGSETEIEPEPNIFIWAEEPYVRVVNFVNTPIQWLVSKLKPRVLSSLDYAFTYKQSNT